MKKNFRFNVSIVYRVKKVLLRSSTKNYVFCVLISKLDSLGFESRIDVNLPELSGIEDLYPQISAPVNKMFLLRFLGFSIMNTFKVFLIFIKIYFKKY